MTNKSISFYTLGCRLNQSETTVIEGTFYRDGYKVVPFDEPADVVVINTCTVTENGDADTRRLVNKINRLNPQARIALIGCQAQIQKEKLTQLPNVRWVVGNARKMELASILRELSDVPEPQVITPTIPRDSFTMPTAGVDAKHIRANIKIQDGCDFFCSFCEIPYARGRARSREFADILKEASILVENGHQELVITGINVGTYAHQGKSLLDVLTALEEINGLKRIRMSSIEPTTIPMDIIKKMAGPSKLCRYLHIPIQSADDEILTAMKRKYSFEDIRLFIKRTRELVADICVGTDVIVGFPGESEQHFQNSENRLRDLPIDYIHVFSYSQRHLAQSQHLGKTVLPNEIKERSRLLRALSLEKRRLFYQKLLGTTQTVLIEQMKGRLWTGVTDHYARVGVDSSDHLANQMVQVRLEKIVDETIHGSLLTSANTRSQHWPASVEKNHVNNGRPVI